MIPASPDPLTLRVRELLDHAIRVSGHSRRMVESRLGVSRGYLTQLLSGKIELKFTTAHRILAFLDFPPATFFQLAYGPHSTSGSDSLERSLLALESLRSSRAQIPPSSLADDSLRRVVQDLVIQTLTELSTARSPE